MRAHSSAFDDSLVASRPKPAVVQLLEEERPEQRRERAAERDAAPELEVEPAALGDPAAHLSHEVQHVPTTFTGFAAKIGLRREPSKFSCCRVHAQRRRLSQRLG